MEPTIQGQRARRAVRGMALAAPVALAIVALGAPSVVAELPAREQWAWDGSLDERPHPVESPVVAQLTDDDGNGVIDARDSPDVAFLHWALGGGEDDAALTLLDGLTGARHRTILDPPMSAIRAGGTGGLLAVADVDADGEVELLVTSRTHVHAIESDGSVAWTRPWPEPLRVGAASLAVADLDQDGVPEVHAQDLVLSTDGSWGWAGGAGPPEPRGSVGSSHAVDLDDGSPGLELLYGNLLYSASGVLLWEAPVAHGAVAVGDLTGDGEPEIVVTSERRVHLLDRRGSVIAAPVDRGDRVRGPAIGDLDGDGLDELVVADGTELTALRWDGLALVPVWTRPTEDPSCCAVPTLHDLDGDGDVEVFYTDQERFLVLDGCDGGVLFEDAFVSATNGERPVVADIDGDGVSEVIVLGLQGLSSSTAHRDHVVAYEIGCSFSPPARAIWNQHEYHVTNVLDDGTVPAVEEVPWERGTGWGAQSSGGEPPTPHRPFGPAWIEAPGACDAAVMVRWEPADWCGPAQGTYDVHRSDSEPPSCADALASAPIARGLTAEAFLATGGLPGRSHAYAVRARDAGLGDCDVETACAGTVATPSGVRPAGLGAVLRIAIEGGSPIASWTRARPLEEGEHFHVLVAERSPSGPFLRVHPEPGTGRRHALAACRGPSCFVEVRVANACEIESIDSP